MIAGALQCRIFAAFGRLFHRSQLVCGRKVGTAQSTLLPNGKGSPMADTASATENNRPDSSG